MTQIHERAGIADRLLRPLARAVVNSPPGKLLASRWSLPWLFARPMADYGFVAALFKQFQLGQVEGDILEQGAWLGFGTRDLAKLAEPHGKTVHAVDVFTTDFGRPETVNGSARRYLKTYPGMTQRQVFDANTRGCSNVVVHAGDVLKLVFPPTQRFACVVIDAGKTIEENKGYLDLAWPHTTGGGVVFVDDYGNPECPGVGQGVDQWIAEHRSEVRSIHVKSERRIIAIERERSG